MFGPNCHPASANCPTFSTWQSARKFYHVTDVYDVTAYQMVQLRVGISSLSFSLSFSRWPNFLCQNIQDKIFHRFHSTHASDPFLGYATRDCLRYRNQVNCHSRSFEIIIAHDMRKYANWVMRSFFLVGLV